MVSYKNFNEISNVLNPKKHQSKITIDALLTLSQRKFCKAAQELGKAAKSSPSNSALKFEELHEFLCMWVYKLDSFIDDIGPELDRITFTVTKLGRYMKTRKLIDTTGKTDRLLADMKACLNDIYDNTIDPENHKLSTRSEKYLKMKDNI